MSGIPVTSLAEVWIETPERQNNPVTISVTSLAEVWIETSTMQDIVSVRSVTSLAEVWIETNVTSKDEQAQRSLPLRKCGLKRD